MAPSNHTFHWADYCVFALVLVLSLLIGLYHACRGSGQNTKDKYLVGDRKLGLIPVTISVLVSLISANTVLGVPAEMYAHGINYWLFPIGLAPVCIAVAFIFVPLLYPLKITSCYEYLELRFNSSLPKKMGSLLLIVKQMLYIGTVLFGPATALEAVTGLPAFASIILVSGVATIYTALGGMKAVIWTDVFQSVIMVGGMIAIVVQGVNRVGGIKRVFDINSHDSRIDFSDFMEFNLAKRFNFWSFTIGYTVYWMGECGINQPIAQRYCALPTITKAKISMIVNFPGFVLMLTLSSLAGLTAYAFYAQKGCDPLYTGEISNSNQVLPLFTMEVLGYPGFPGLMLSCVFSGSLSTVSSSLNSMAACVWEDFLKSCLPNLSESRVTSIIKLIVFLFGGICLGTAFLVSSLGGTMIQLSISFIGLSLGPMIGMYALGGLTTFCNAAGAVGGAILGFAFPMWMFIGYLGLNLQNKKLPGRTYSCFNVTNYTTVTSMTYTTDLPSTSPTSPELTGLNRFYSVSFVWYPLIGLVITLVFGCLISLITNQKLSNHKPVPKFLLFSFVRPCLGEKSEYEIGSATTKTNITERNYEWTSLDDNDNTSVMQHRSSYEMKDL